MHVPCLGPVSCFHGDRKQDHPQEKDSKKAKWLSEEALKIAVKRMDKKAMVHIHNGVLLSH